MFLILFEMIVEKNLYIEFRRVTGRQFFRESLSFPLLGMQVIVPSNIKLFK